MRCFDFILVAILFCGNAVFAAPNELAKIESQIRQTEQKNKQLEQQVKTSDRDVANTK